MKTAIDWVERGFVPDPLVRWGIRRLLSQRLEEERERWAGRAGSPWDAWLEHMRAAEVAPVPDKANEQHYEVPAAFYELALGPQLKYSGALWEPSTESLGEAEEAMLALTAERAELADGQQVLELGCGWGSLSLWMAEHFPNSRIVSVSNSSSQREHIARRAQERRLTNLEVRTADMNVFATDQRFDRVVSVEMFEHMRNWETLLGRVHEWLLPTGSFFAHVFAHHEYAYPFETVDDSDWMAKYFFTGGMMPSDDLFSRVCERAPFDVAKHWVVDGTHYARTAAAWRANVDAQREAVRAVLDGVYGRAEGGRWLRRWRLFFMACEELFGFRGGKEWWVAHTLLTPQATEGAR